MAKWSVPGFGVITETGVNRWSVPGGGVVTESTVSGVTLLPGLLTVTSVFYDPSITRGSVTLSAPLLSNTNSFFSPVVSSGSAFLLPSLLSNTNSFFSPVVSSGSVTLTVSLLSDSNSFFSPTITRGSVTLTVSLLSNTNSFFSPVVNSGVFLTPALFSNTNSFFSPTITRGSVTLSVSLLSNSNSFFAPSVLPASIVLLPSVFNNSNLFYNATVTRGSVTLGAPRIDSTSAFYSPTVGTGSSILLPSLLSNTNTLFAPTIVGGAAALLPPRLLNTSVFFGPTILGGSATLLAPLIVSVTNLQAPIVSRTQSFLFIPRIQNTSVLYSHAVLNPLAPLTSDKISYWNGTDWVPLVRKNINTFILSIGDEVTAITVGNGKYKFRTPNGWVLHSIPKASLNVAQVSGTIFTVDIKDQGVSILSRLITIDNTELSSITAALAPIYSKSDIEINRELSVDVMQIGDGTAAGLKLYLQAYDAFMTAIERDPHFSSVILLLDFDGVNASTAFTDTSLKLRTPTVVGNAQYDTAIKRFGTASGESDGNVDRVTWASSSDFSFGTEDYTIELSFYCEQIGGGFHNDLFSSGPFGTNQITIRLTNIAKIEIYFNNGVNALGVLSGPTTFVINKWYDVMLRRIAGTTTVIVDGTTEITSAASYNVASGGVACLFENTVFHAGTRSLDGYIDNFRITKGVGRLYVPLTKAFVAA